MKKILTLILCACLPIASIGANEEDAIAIEEGNVIYFASDDKEMLAAHKEAQTSVFAITENYEMLIELQADINIKVKLSQGDNNEHFWLHDVIYKDGEFHGTLGNYPVSLTNYKFGDPVSVKPNNISDWFIIMGSEFLGGYTMKVSRNRMDDAARANFDEMFPYILMSEQAN